MPHFVGNVSFKTTVVFMAKSLTLGLQNCQKGQTCVPVCTVRWQQTCRE